MSEVMNVRGDECRGDECRTTAFLLGSEVCTPSARITLKICLESESYWTSISHASKALCEKRKPWDFIHFVEIC